MSDISLLLLSLLLASLYIIIMTYEESVLIIWKEHNEILLNEENEREREIEW